MNGWTPTPRNPERIAYDEMREQEFLARQYAAEQQRINFWHLVESMDTVDDAIDYSVRGEKRLVTMEAVNPPDVRERRRNDILYAIENEPIDLEAANGLLDELAALDQDMQHNPAIVDGVSSPGWFDAQEEVKW